MKRRQFLRSITGAAGLAVLPRARAQDAYPNRPARILAGFAAGGGVDITARLMGQWLNTRLGQPFVVENRTGADGNIATEAVIKAPADGYTLLLATLPNAVNASLYPRLNFVFLRDIAPVAGIIRVPMVVLVHPALPATSLGGLIAYAKENSGKVNMASAGTGSAPHVAGELFNAMAGVNMVHVPYRGVAPALTDLLGGQVQVMAASSAASIEYIRSSKLRALAVTGPTRTDVLPDIPSVGEFLPGYEASGWFGVGAPRNTPGEIIDRLNNEINAGLADPRIKARFADLGGTVLGGSAADFGKFVADETEKWSKVVKFAGAKAS